jgi:hypothetical protein
VTSATYTDFSSGTEVIKDIAESQYSTTTNGRESFVLTHILNNDIESPNLDCSVITFKVTVTNDAGLSENLTIKQFPPIYITSELSNGYVYINANSNREKTSNFWLIADDGTNSESVETTYSPTLNNNTRNYFSDGLISITFDSYYSQYSTWPARYVRYMQSPSDDGPGTITIEAPSGCSITRVDIGYYNNNNRYDVTYSPNGTSSSKTRWEGNASSVLVTMAANNQGANLVSSISVRYRHLTNQQTMGSIRRYDYGMSGSGALSNPNIYTISVSDLSQTDFYIADPRAGSLVSYSTLREGGSGSQLTNYNPLSTSSGSAVAPKIKIASAYGASLSATMSFDNAVKRCASYQESGYPAGRWRVPTDAEIRFMVYLSKNKKIPSFFNGVYWGSSGSRGTRLHVTVETDETSGEITDITVTEETNQTEASVRCVYDAWYWGDEPVNNYMTSWSGWQN